MKPMQNFGFNLAAWIVLVMVYVIAVIQLNCETNWFYAIGGAVGIIGLAQALSDFLAYKKRG